MSRNIVLILLVLIPLVFFSINKLTAAPIYEGPVSDHFNGDKFFNRLESDKSVWDIIRLFSGHELFKEIWPDWIENDPTVVSPMVNRSRALRVTFINHSSFLIQVDDVNILTDPVFSERTSPVSWAGPKRVRAPGIPLDTLPPIDVILISHNHYDHLDIDALKTLYKRQQTNEPLILAGLGNSGLFVDEGLPRHEDLDWGETASLDQLRITFVESRHRSGRGVLDQMKTLWGSYVIESSVGPIYFAGDTGYGPHFKDAHKRYGDFHLSLLPIGAYEPRWFMRDIHLNPDEAVQAHLDLQSTNSVSMHFGTFQLTREAVDQPVKDLATALEKYKVNSNAFLVLAFGETKQYE